MLRLLTSIGLVSDDFDEDFYRKFYSDLPSGADARRHYRRHGAAEGRFRNFREALTALQERHGAIPGDFSPSSYRALNPDVGALYKEEWRLALHYVAYGRAEGRRYRQAGPAPGENGGSAAPDGAASAPRPPQAEDFALEVPFGYAPRETGGATALAALLHCARPERLPAILSKLEEVPLAVDLYLSADTEPNRLAALARAGNWRKGTVEARIAPGCALGVAPLVTCFREVFERYGLLIHLHTGAGPRHDPIDDLIGGMDIARSVLSLFADPHLGVVFPQREEGSAQPGWGPHYARARSLMRGLGVSPGRVSALEFPSDGVFIARCAAIRPMLDLGLREADFVEEGEDAAGSATGALLRSLLILSESTGHEWLKVARKDRRRRQALAVRTADDLAPHRLKIYRPLLSGVDAPGWSQVEGPPQMRPLRSYPSRNARPRLTLLAPEIEPASGALALEVFSRIATELGGGWDRRIVCVDATPDPALAAGLGAALETTPGACAVEPCAPSLDEARRVLVDASGRDGPLNLRRGDVFLATSWWTATLARELEADRRRAFGGDLPGLRFIADDEPGLHGASARAALVADSYRDAGRTLAIVHSEELFAEVGHRQSFRAAWCLPHSMDEGLAGLLTPAPRERQILVYARPGVAQDAFELVCDALLRWQQNDLPRAGQWSLLFVGEDFPARRLGPLQNASVGGRLTREAYAERLNRAAVGLSLTLSPHPGPASLDMAAAGLQTVANRYAQKDPRVRFPGVVAPDCLTGDSVAAAIETAVALAEPTIGKCVEAAPGRLPPLVARQLLDVERLAAMVASEVVALPRRGPPAVERRPSLRRLFEQAEA